MQDYYEGCETRVGDRQIILEENRCSITFVNNSRKEIRIIEVDGCVITEGRRCDYLLVPPEKTEYYVELKGKNVKHAVEQIEATIAELSADKRKHPKYAFVVCTRCPLSGQDVNEYRQKFMENYRASLQIHRLKHRVTL